MTIDTRKKVITFQLRRMISLLVFAISVILVLLVGKMPNTFLGLNKYGWSIVILVVFVLSIVIEGLLQYHYIYFSDEKEKIVLRYFSLGYMNRVKKSIELPKNELQKYEITESLYGFKKKIVLHRVKNTTEAKYPSVCLSILNKKELAMLTKTLDSYKKE